MEQAFNVGKLMKLNHAIRNSVTISLKILKLRAMISVAYLKIN